MNENIKTNSLKAWIYAIRPKTLSGATAPVIIASALAHYYDVFATFPFIICLLFALIMQIAANFINDLYDYKKGSDREDRLGPDRACSKGWISIRAMKIAIVSTMTLALITGSLLLFYGGIELIFIAILCLVFAYLYTGGKYPLAYYGLGDVLVLIFFGIVPVCATFYVMSGYYSFGYINLPVFILSIACGIVIDLLLVVNNYRDIEQDIISNKKTIIVLLGSRFGRYLYLYLGFISVLLCCTLFFFNFRYSAFLPLIFIPFHFKTWIDMCRINKGKELNKILAKTSRNIILFSILVTIGLIIDKILT